MEKIIILLISIFLCRCNNPTMGEETEKFFNPNDLEKLEIANYTEFWEPTKTTDSLITVVNYYNSDDEIFKSVRYKCDTKIIEVSVYKSSDAALITMEESINTVACIIIKGDSNMMEDKLWWYSNCIPKMIL